MMLLEKLKFRGFFLVRESSTAGRKITLPIYRQRKAVDKPVKLHILPTSCSTITTTDST